MLTTGTVQLSLADVDKLRDQIKKAEDEVKQKNAEIEQLKSKQREVLIKEVQIADNGLQIDAHGIGRDLRSINHLNKEFWGSSFYNAYEDQIIRIVSQRVSARTKEVERKVYYKNLDDIQSELRLKIEAEYEERIRDMSSKVRGCDDTIREIKDKEMLRYKDLQKKMEDVITDKNKLIEQLMKQIQELETGIREKKETERLKEDLEFWNFAFSYINNKIHQLKEKSWIKKLFGNIDETVTLEAIRKAFERSKAEKGE